jgi:UDP-N-acetylmuramate--alanine ligase
MKRSRLFFSGIAGSGLSSIACFMKDTGYNVSGSDRLFDSDPEHQLKAWFQGMGIDIYPQDGSGIDAGTDLVIYSSAIEGSNPELRRVGDLGILRKSRQEFLIELSSSFETIAVSGTSGKSTTSGLLAFLMKRLGLDPNFIGGAGVKQFVSASNLGNHLAGGSDYLVLEACESDGMIVHYKPAYTIILNISLDHHSIDETARMFRKLMENTGQYLLLNADDNRLTGLLDEGKIITFSIHNPSPYRAERVEFKPFSSEFFLRDTRFELPLPGEHNIYNALSCIAFLSEIGISPRDISIVLKDFKGLRRRFDIHLNNSHGFVVDDYAHNPHKIQYLMKTVNRFRDKICYIFQPHGYGPTRFMKDDYIRVFSENLSDSDHLILLPIYYAGGTVSRDISSHDLAEGIRKNGRSVEVVEDRKEIFNHMGGWSNYVVFGARDDSLSGLAGDIAKALTT